MGWGWSKKGKIERLSSFVLKMARKKAAGGTSEEIPQIAGSYPKNL
jgi:hypothetical protein